MLLTYKKNSALTFQNLSNATDCCNSIINRTHRCEFFNFSSMQIRVNSYMYFLAANLLSDLSRLMETGISIF